MEQDLNKLNSPEKPESLELSPEHRELLVMSDPIREAILSGCTKDGVLDTALLQDHLLAHISIHIVKIKHIERQIGFVNQAFEQILDIAKTNKEALRVVDHDIPQPSANSGTTIN